MGFSKDIINAALSQKALQKKSAERTAEAARMAVYDKCPELASLDMQISASGAQIAMAAISGENIDSIKDSLGRLTDKRRVLIQKCGGNEQDFKPEYSCEKCNDTGFIHGKMCSCVAELCKKLTTEAMSAHMPLSASRFDNFDISLYPETGGKVSPRKRMSGILDFCRKYAAEFNGHSASLLFLGNTGLGKTHLSLAIAGEVIAKGYGVIYGPSVRLLGQIEKEHFSKYGSTDYLDSVLECDLLIIDDLGTEYITPFSVSVINNIVNSRILENRPTIISTNLSLAELEEKYSPRVVSRLTGIYTIKQFLGEDIRQQKFNK